jgi:hypothetical protein
MLVRAERQRRRGRPLRVLAERRRAPPLRGRVQPKKNSLSGLTTGEFIPHLFLFCAALGFAKEINPVKNILSCLIIQ